MESKSFAYNFDYTENINFSYRNSFHNFGQQGHDMKTPRDFLSKNLIIPPTTISHSIRWLLKLLRFGSNCKSGSALKQEKQASTHKEETQDIDHSRDFYHIPRGPKAMDGPRVNDRVRTFVVIEVYEGQQIIKNWRCGDLVHYVNKIGSCYSKKNRINQSLLHNNKKNPYQCTTVLKNAADKRSIDHQPLHSLDTTNKVHIVEFHHHYYHCGCDHRKHGSGQKNRDTRFTGQLTYRDLRQVFTDGNPVASIEVRCHCIILCLPPLSCIIMADRVFILIVEEIIIDQLIYGLQKLQKKHMALKQADNHPFPRQIIGEDFGCASQETPLSPKNTVEKKLLTYNAPLNSSHSASDKIETIKEACSLEDDLFCLRDPGNHSPIGIKADIDGGYLNHDIPSCQTNRSADSGSSVALPMELEALELLFSAAFSQLTNDISRLEERLHEIVSKAAYQSPTKHAGQVLHVLKSHTRLYGNRVLLYDKALDNLISKPDEMIQMELTRLKHELADTDNFHNQYEITNSLSQEPNPDLEILLEYFDQEIEQLRQRVSRVIEGIESVERLASLNLSLSRNQLLRWDVGSGMVAVVVGISALITGVFGMNVKIPMESKQYSFEIISSSIAFLTLMGMIIIYIIIRMTRL